MEEKTLICKECSKEFQHKVSKQASNKELVAKNEPQSCPDCKKAIKPEKPKMMGRGGTSAG